MSLALNHYFPAEKYPEFAQWNSVMNESDAIQYVKNSKIQARLFHETFSDRAKGIRSVGVDMERSTPTVEFASGHYMAVSREYVTDRFGSEVIEHMALIKNPFQIADRNEFGKWQKEMGLSGLTSILLPRVSKIELLEKGYDGIHILRDTVGVENSESWLAFHPKQVVTLPV